MKPLKDLLDSVRHIDGFPKAKDEDILELSDPPHYTACPNPYINDFIKEHGKPYDPKNDDYHREPFIGDISEGKNDPIYNAHSYHTKVPHKAIMKFIEHYTSEGDIVFDGFCGTGMTGVAAQMLNRKAILSDLSPIATFIAYNYNNPVDPDQFEKEAKRILKEVEEECGWLYETNHPKHNNFPTQKNFHSQAKGKINYTVWSDVFICPYCNNEYIFWDAAVDKEEGKVKDKFPCPHCTAEIRKTECKRATVTLYDTAINQEIIQAKQVPVLINYSYNNKRYEKKPDEYDLELIEKINNMEIPYWFPTDRMPEGDEARRNDRTGITHVHHFYTKRNLWVLSSLSNIIQCNLYKIILIVLLTNNSRMSRYGKRTGNVSGTLYIPSLIKELNVIEYLKRKLHGPKGIITPITVLSEKLISRYSISTSSIILPSNIEANSIDYIFTDPPFGANLMYSELNFVWESWLRVFTNNKTEAIINKSQSKGLNEYTHLMTLGFKEMYRILKPNRWITVEFHNSKASVWNGIQEAMTRAGFLIAQVAVLDKKQGSFKQVTTAGAVKNDLIINAYKPREEFAYKFLRRAGEGMEVDFIAEQLGHLPVEPNIERSEKMLYSKMLAHYVENGFKIGYDAKKFYDLLSNNFMELDGYWFLDSQVKKYNEWKSKLNLDQIKDIKKRQQLLFVSDEKSALIWIFHYLTEPRSYSDIFTAYQKVATKTDDEIPELREILDNNFILEGGMYRRPMDNIEREKISKSREKELEREFQRLLHQAKEHKNKIRNVRREALVHGFTKCYQEGNYQDIIILAECLHDSVIEASGEIMDFIDIAKIKISGGF